MKAVMISLILSANIYLQNSYNLPLEEYSQIELDQSIGITLFWHVDFHAQLVNLQVEIQNNKSGEDDFRWFAIGFSGYGQLSEADLCFMWCDEQEKEHFQHVWTDDKSQIIIDQKENQCILSTRERRKNSFVFSSSRSFKSSSKNARDYLIEEGTTHIVYATGQGLISSINNLKLDSFTHGFKRVNLLKDIKNEMNLLKISKNGQNIELVNEELLLPANHVTYWCKSFLLPQEFTLKKHHIVGFEAIISPKWNDENVHHMRLLHLEDPENVLSEFNWNGLLDSLIESNEYIRKIYSNSREIVNWAKGADPFILPLEAGFPIGGKNYSRHVILEIHYENANERSDIIDSSGVKIYYTSQLRKYDADIFSIGIDKRDYTAIPPGESSFTLTGYCTSKCTRTSIPSGGIMIFASQLHTHMLGKQVSIRHVRNKTQLPELIRDNHYSANFQEFRMLQKPVKVMPGDELMIECRYDSTSKQNITLFGGTLGNQEEMCSSYNFYYPKIDLTLCSSGNDGRKVNEYFGYMNEHERQPTDWQNKTWRENFRSIHWNSRRAKFLENFYHSLEPINVCY